VKDAWPLVRSQRDPGRGEEERRREGRNRVPSRSYHQHAAGQHEKEKRVKSRQVLTDIRFEAARGGGKKKKGGKYHFLYMSVEEREEVYLDHTGESAESGQQLASQEHSVCSAVARGVLENEREGGGENRAPQLLFGDIGHVLGTCWG